MSHQVCRIGYSVNRFRKQWDENEKTTFGLRRQKFVARQDKRTKIQIRPVSEVANIRSDPDLVPSLSCTHERVALFLLSLVLIEL